MAPAFVGLFYSQRLRLCVIAVVAAAIVYCTASAAWQKNGFAIAFLIVEIVVIVVVGLMHLSNQDHAPGYETENRA